jgi:hypothetical protein
MSTEKGVSELIAEDEVRHALWMLVTAIHGGGCSGDIWEQAIENAMKNAERVLREVKP